LVAPVVVEMVDQIQPLLPPLEVLLAQQTRVAAGAVVVVGQAFMLVSLVVQAS
jgi:hypothetical protein